MLSFVGIYPAVTMRKTRHTYKAQHVPKARAHIDKRRQVVNARISSCDLPLADATPDFELARVKTEEAERNKIPIGEIKRECVEHNPDDRGTKEENTPNEANVVSDSEAQFRLAQKRKLNSRLAKHKRVPSLIKDIFGDIEELPESPTVDKVVARKVAELRRRHYRGKVEVKKHPKTKPRSILDNLIATILSQATTSSNSSRSFATLKNSFPNWEDAISAGPPAIEDAIRIGGLAQNKSRVIYYIWTELKDSYGKCSLEHFRGLPDGEVKAALCAFKGVGPKTAACVLMSAMRRAEFPVDTHVCRISGRLGWMPPDSTPEKT